MMLEPIIKLVESRWC